MAYPRIYHGLDWDKTYTYVEARPHIAKALIGWMGKTRGGLIVGDECSEFRVYYSQEKQANRLGKPYKPLPTSIVR